MPTETKPETSRAIVMTADELLHHWQGHRRLTRRVIDAFPEDKLFQFSVGGMRPFAQMAQEFIEMAMPIVNGVSTGKWEKYAGEKPATKSDLLALWDAQTAAIDKHFPRIPPHRFAETDTAFGMYTATGMGMFEYGIDNEIHHRGQGYVYLRALGIEPPHFWERE